MTEEEIKDKSLEYVMRTDDPNDTIGERRKRQEDFIAGAHSRDEEIEELQKVLSDKRWKYADVTLPELNEIHEFGACHKGSLLVRIENKHDKYVRYASSNYGKWMNSKPNFLINLSVFERITHWMQIPELNEG